MNIFDPAEVNNMVLSAAASARNLADQNGTDGTTELWQEIECLVREAVAIMDANSKPWMADRDECNAESLAKALSHAAWGCLIGIGYIERLQSKADKRLIAGKLNLFRRWQSQSVGGRPSWECPGCGHRFVGPDSRHYPCNGTD